MSKWMHTSKRSTRTESCTRKRKTDAKPARSFLWDSVYGQQALVSTHTYTHILSLCQSQRAPTEFCKKLSHKLDGQDNKRALEKDTHLRLNGAPLGDVYAIGDCSTLQHNVAGNTVSLLQTLSLKEGKDPHEVRLTFEGWGAVAEEVKRRFPPCRNPPAPPGPPLCAVRAKPLGHLGIRPAAPVAPST